MSGFPSVLFFRKGTWLLARRPRGRNAGFQGGRPFESLLRRQAGSLRYDCVVPELTQVIENQRNHAVKPPKVVQFWFPNLWPHSAASTTGWGEGFALTWTCTRRRRAQQQASKADNFSPGCRTNVFSQPADSRRLFRCFEAHPLGSPLDSTAILFGALAAFLSSFPDPALY